MLCWTRKGDADLFLLALTHCVLARRLQVPKKGSRPLFFSRGGISRDMYLGGLIDRWARLRLRRWLAAEGIADRPGQVIQVNRWLRDPRGSGAYRIPDIRVGGARLIFDGTIGQKTITTEQCIDFLLYSGEDRIIIVRPTQIGGSCELLFPGVLRP
jgi:hypothetical protein